MSCDSDVNAHIGAQNRRKYTKIFSKILLESSVSASLGLSEARSERR